MSFRIPALFAMILTGAFAAPQLASAESIKHAALDASTDDIVVTFDTSGPMLLPTLTTSAGRIRMLFPGEAPHDAITVHGDGQYLHDVEVSGGAGGTIAAHLRLTGDTRVEPQFVHIETHDTSIVVRIAKNKLHPVVVKAAPAPAPVAATPIATAAAALASPIVAAKAEAKPVVADDAEEAAPVAAKTAEKAEKKHESSAASTPAFAGAIPGSMGPSVPVLLFITLLLGTVYLALRAILKTRAPSKPTPSIQILSVKHVGPRHKLIIVRSFGRDHLLSINGGETRRIASMRAEEEEDIEEVAAALKSQKRSDLVRDDDSLRLQDLKLGRNINTILPRENPRDSLAPGPDSEIRTKVSLTEETQFGAELLKMVRSSTQPPAARRPNNDSVSGLMRLKKQAAR